MTPDECRAVFRHLASGVTVVTTFHEGKIFGMTATSFTSVSIDPILVQVSLSKDARTHDAVRDAGTFAANILASHQETVARDFATPKLDRETIARTHAGEMGLPLIDGAAGYFECRVTNTMEGGDHTIFLAEVFHGGTEDRPPLVYFDGGYTTLDQTKGTQ